MCGAQLGNRLFEPLRVSLLTNTSSALQRQAAFPAGASTPEHPTGALPYAVLSAGEDVAVQRAHNGFVFELETTGAGIGYRHVYISKPLLIDCHAPAPADALDLTISFTRVQILDSAGNKVQQHSSEYHHLARQHPAEFSALAEVVGWAQPNTASNPTIQYDKGSFPCDHAGLTNIKTHMWSTCVRTIRVFAPFWLVNRQPVPLVVSYCHRSLQYMAPCDWRLLGVPPQEQAFLALGVAEAEAGYLLSPCKDGLTSAPVEEIAAATSWKASGPKLCPGFRVDIVGRSTAVSVSSPNTYDKLNKRPRKKFHLFGVTVALAPPPFSRSKIINIYSRFVLKNTLPCDLWVKESSGSCPPIRLASGSQCNFHPQAIGPRGEALICITTTDPAIIQAISVRSETQHGETSETVGTPADADGKGRPIERTIWSSNLSVARSATLQIRVKNPVESSRSSRIGKGMPSDRKIVGREGRSLAWTHQNIQIAIRSLEGASFVVVFSEPSASEYLLVNNTNHLIAFAQSGLRHKNAWELLERGQQVDYAWTDPQRERKHLRFSFWDCNQQVFKSCDIARVRVHRPVTLPNSKETIYFITDVFGGRRRVTATNTVPHLPGDSPRGGRKAWMGLQHDLFRIRRKGAAATLRRDIRFGGRGLKPQSALCTGILKPLQLSLMADGKGSPFQGYSEGPPAGAPRRGSIPLMRTEKHLAQRIRASRTGWAAGQVKASQPAGLADELITSEGAMPQKMLRFQQGAKLLSESGHWAGSAISSTDDPFAFIALDDDAWEAEFPDAKAIRYPRRLDNKERGAPERHRVTNFLRNRPGSCGPFGSTGARSPPANLAGRGNSRRSCGLGHRLPMTWSSSEINEDFECSNGGSFSAMGFYLCLSIRGVGISLVDSTPQELAFLGCSGIRVEARRLHGAATRDFRCSVSSLQIDNGVAGAQHQTILRRTTLEERLEHHGTDSRLMRSGDGFKASGASEGVLRAVVKPFLSWDAVAEREVQDHGLFFRVQLGGEWLEEATLLEYVDCELAPIALHIEADTTFVLLRFVMQLLRNRNFFLRSLQDRSVQLVRQAANNDADSTGYQQLRAFPEATVPVLASLRPLYIHAIALQPMLIILSARSQRLQRRHVTAEQDDLMAVRHFEVLGDRMTDITNFPLKSRLVVQQSVFTTSEQLVADLGSSYFQQGIRQLHKLVASIDVIGNPLRLITGVSSSLRVLTTQLFKGTLLLVDR